MKKILTALMLLALFVSCSSDDDNTDLNNNGNNNGMIDEKILGKWKVEYSKTIKGARFLEDGTLEIAEGAVITEYEGEYDIDNTGIQEDIKSGLFNIDEYKIEINKNSTTSVYQQYKLNPNTIYYKIEDGLLKWIEKPIPGVEYTHPVKAEHKYKIKDNKLIIERIPESKNSFWYTISEYSRIKE